MKTQLPHVALALILAATTSAAFAGSKDVSASDRAEVEALKAQVNAIAKTRHAEKAHLANFDDLDFNVYSGQEMG